MDVAFSVDPTDRAIRPDHSEFSAEFCSLLKGHPHGVIKAAAIFRMHGVEEALVATAGECRIEPKQFSKVCRITHGVGCNIPIPHPEIGCRHGQAQLFFSRPKLSLGLLSRGDVTDNSAVKGLALGSPTCNR